MDAALNLKLVHTQDSDCTVDPETQFCTGCDVDHTDECRDCKGRGFHNEGCPSLAEAGAEDQALGASDHFFEQASGR